MQDYEQQNRISLEAIGAKKAGDMEFGQPRFDFEEEKKDGRNRQRVREPLRVATSMGRDYHVSPSYTTSIVSPPARTQPRKYDNIGGALRQDYSPIKPGERGGAFVYGNPPSPLSSIVTVTHNGDEHSPNSSLAAPWR
jgi:hypothetical protein